MKKWSVMCLTLLILLGFAGLTSAQSSQDQNNKASFTGVYNVTFTTDQGQSYSARVIVQDLKNGKVELSGDYNGYPVSILGEVTGNVEEGGAVCSFSFNKAEMVMGKAEITIVMVAGKYQLSGKVSGSYSYLGNNGQFSGKVIGSRKSSTVPTNHSPLRTAATVAGIAALIALVWYITRIYRKRTDISLDSDINSRVLVGKNAAVYLAHYGYLSEQGKGRYQLTGAGRELIQGHSAGNAGRVLRLVYQGDINDFVDIDKITAVVSR